MGIIRLILALSVVIGHAGGLEGFRDELGRTVILTDGRTAVKTFYLISGFYMALVLDRVYTGPGSTAAFWTSRYLRLAPAYVLVSVFTLFFVIDTARFEEYDIWLLAAAALSHLALVGQDIFMFFGYAPSINDVKFMPDILQGGLAENPGYDPGWALLMIEPGWSIGVEVWFYLLAPFILRLETRFIVLIAVCSFALKLTLSTLFVWGDGDPWNYRFFPNELFIFLIGSLSYKLYSENKFVITDQKKARYLLFLIYMILLFYLLLPGGTSEKITVLFVILFFSLPTIFHLTKSWRLDRWIGELSYPAYISHMAIIALLPSLGAWKGYAVIAATLVVSTFLFVLLDAPVDRFRHVLARRMMRGKES